MKTTVNLESQLMGEHCVLASSRLEGQTLNPKPSSPKPSTLKPEALNPEDFRGGFQVLLPRSDAPAGFGVLGSRVLSFTGLRV